MRPPMLVSFAIAAPLAGAYALRSVTGDTMSAAFLALTLTVTAIAWQAGISRAGRASRRS
jgi:hypothetical protein